MSRVSDDVRPDEPPTPRPPPERVGPYLIRSRIGAGGMGEVYRAWDTRLEREVAVKKVLAKDSRRETSRQRLRGEARAIARLSHPAIVRIFDLIEDEAGDWMVMELIEGRTISSLLRSRALVEAEALALAREITEGLVAAHSKGLVHRDLKSENVMVTHLGHVKILDFGLAQPYVGAEDDDSSSSMLTTRSRVVGTSRAMSPEQAKGLPLDPRSDLFSLGSLIYEMVTGESPFQGSSTYVTMTRVCYHRQRPARELNGGVSPELSNFIDHLLEKDPKRRPQSAQEATTVLDSLAGIAPLPPSLGYLLWPTESSMLDASSMSDSTAGVPKFLPKSLLLSKDLRSSIFIWTVLAVELSNAAELLSRRGDEPASRILLHFDRAVRDLLAEFSGFEIDKTGAFLLLFRRPIDAVRYSLTLRQRLEDVSQKLEVELVTRIGIHVGEVHLRENPTADVERGAKRFEAEGRTKVIAAQVMQQGRPGQILVTQGVYELARLAKLDLDASDHEAAWRKHSQRNIPGLDDHVSIFEVTLDGDEPAGSEPSGPATTAGKRHIVLLAVLGAVLLAAAFAVFLLLGL